MYTHVSFIDNMTCGITNHVRWRQPDNNRPAALDYLNLLLVTLQLKGSLDNGSDVENNYIFFTQRFDSSVFVRCTGVIQSIFNIQSITQTSLLTTLLQKSNNGSVGRTHATMGYISGYRLYHAQCASIGLCYFHHREGTEMHIAVPNHDVANKVRGFFNHLHTIVTVCTLQY